MSFKDKYSHEDRVKESTKILAKYPDRIPVIVDCDKKFKLPKCKFIVPMDLTLGQFQHLLRKSASISHEIAIFMFFNKKNIEPTGTLMGDIYDRNKDMDNFLYCRIEGENTFGFNA